MSALTAHAGQCCCSSEVVRINEPPIQDAVHVLLSSPKTFLDPRAKRNTQGYVGIMSVKRVTSERWPAAEPPLKPVHLLTLSALLR